MSGGIGVYPKLPRVSVRDNFGAVVGNNESRAGIINDDDDDDEDDELSDIDDEVFIRDGKHGGILKLAGAAAGLGGSMMMMGHHHLNLGRHQKNNDEDDDYDRGVKRPLMAPRRGKKFNKAAAAGGGSPYDTAATNEQMTAMSLKTLMAIFLYTILGFILIIGIIALCFVAITRLPVPSGIVKDWLAHENKNSNKKPTAGNEQAYVIPCTSLNSQMQWTRTLPRLTSEAPLRSNDVNGDSVLDIIVGFSTGLDTSSATEFTCKLYFDRSAPCLGGVLALDGKTGETIWTHWTAHAIFSVDCGLDLNNDKTKDCVVAGRGGILHAISGLDGTSIWELPSSSNNENNMSIQQQKYYDIYDARYIADMDDDGVGDVVASHTWQAAGSRSEVIIVSGKSGGRINGMNFPGKEELFVAPQVIVHPDGETYLILVASDQEKSGGIYVIPHSKLLKGEFKLQELYHGPGRGVSLPPLLIDVNSDGTEDVIVAMLNSTVMAFDGLTFKEIWNFTIENSEVISIPVPGYYNDDKVPDFMVKHQIGPGFPTYYYTTATVLDGRTGKPLLESPMIDTMSAQMSGLSVTVDGYGNDWFLHWSADCLGKEGARDRYEFFRDADTDADLCRLRFNSSFVATLYAFSQHVGPPGLALYRSENWKSLEFNNTVDPKKTADEYTETHSSSDETRASQDEIISNRASLTNDNGAKVRSKNIESEDFQRPGNFYPKTKDVKYDNLHDEQQQQQQQQQGVDGYLEKALDNVSDNDWKSDKWESDKYRENAPNDENYDDTYDDDEERLIASRQLNEIRLQRSGKSGRYINNDTNDVQNQLDPSMDYTNGQNKQANYYTTSHFSRSNNSDDNSDYLNMPDIDFVDNLKEAEALSEARRRRQAAMAEKNSATLKHNESKRKRRISRAVVGTRFENPFARMFKNYRHKRASHAGSQNNLPGVPRQPPTGILLPALQTTKPGEKNPMDLVFSTFWLPASTTPFVLLPSDLECMRKKMEEKYNGKKLSIQERESLAGECLTARGIDRQSYDEANDKENSKISLGQMTIYRMRLRCACPEDMLAGQTCKDISNQQKWPENLGAAVSGYFDSWRRK